MNNISCASHHKVVLLTGFGPAMTCGIAKDINASGQAVKLVKREELERTLDISLVPRQVPIEYRYVDHNIPKMWQTYLPHLTIHVGVSDIAKGFTLETQARKAGYIYEDNSKKIPEGKENPSDGSDCITTDLEVELLCKEFNYALSDDDLKAEISDDAGNYLCEYIYYTSLCQQLDHISSTLFVHVPPLQSPKELEELARGLERLVEVCVAQIRSHDVEEIPPPPPSIYEEDEDESSSVVE